tara:strand:- start:879 stop:1643 length:765 start_codon:yes stop_codon:yes gene_type:complete
MALDKYSLWDLKHRLNKLKCCFATKMANIVDKQKYGKPCADEKCNAQLLGAYIEMLECLISEGCDCHDEWIAGDSKIWAVGEVYEKDDIVKVYPRQIAIDTDEFLYFRWLGISPTNIYGIGDLVCNNYQCFPDQIQQSPTGVNLDAYLFPCYHMISMIQWSVCGNIKQAWQARGQLVWQAGVDYVAGDIVKFMGGGTGPDQSGQNEFYICANKIHKSCPYWNPNQFHENKYFPQGSEVTYKYWIKLACYDYQII